MTAQSRYDYLSSDRSQFLQAGRDAALLTLPYILHDDDDSKGPRNLSTPWQSVGAKGVTTLSSKLMLALMPPQTSFFKLEVDPQDMGEEQQAQIQTEIDMSLAKIERTIMAAIAQSNDRVYVHQALVNLVISGNALIFMGKKGLKMFPLNRYVVDRDGNGEVIEIVTKERISRKLIPHLVDMLPKGSQGPNPVGDDYGGDGSNDEDVSVFTHVRRQNNRVIWHQEVENVLIPGSQGKAPLDANPWLTLRFNAVDGEVYGRGRVEQFYGDLQSLNALSQALVEGSAAAAKVVFTVSPSASCKPQTLAAAGNGAIVQGRPDDIGVVQVGKTADFKTAYEMAGNLEKRLSDAFLVLQVRESERTTAEEVRMTQQELESQLAAVFSLLTVEFLKPYLKRKMVTLQRTNEIPSLPKAVKPTIVAGINALGRSEDAQALALYLQTIAQTMGPEALQKYINPEEVVKRLAIAHGIDVLNLVKSMQQVQQADQKNMQKMQQMEITKQVGQLASTPMLDPSKNPDAMEMIQGGSETNPNQGAPGEAPGNPNPSP